MLPDTLTSSRVQLAILLALLLVGAASRLSAQDVCPKPSNLRWGIAVLPFESMALDSGVPPLVDSARTRIVAQLCTAGFRVVDRKDIQQRMDRHDKDFTPARYFVLGTAAGWHDSLRLDVRLVNVEIPETIKQLKFQGRIRDLGSLADSAARLVRVALDSIGRKRD